MGEEQFTVIVENDVTQWDDDTGVTYHYPRRYRKHLTPGTRLIHYKGKLTNKAYKDLRLSTQPHYFATSVAGSSREDPSSSKGDLLIDIVDFRPFDMAVHYKDASGQYREEIPANRASNFWRDGVRPTRLERYNAILQDAGVLATFAGSDDDGELTSVLLEGGKKKVYTTVYERRPELRKQAVQLHGTSCFCCEVNLGTRYGEVAQGFIHIHHRRPLYLVGETPVDPKVDLIPLCPTCHAIVHLGGQLRTVNEVRSLLGKGPIPLGD